MSSRVQAERWYQQSLELSNERDRLQRGLCLKELASIAHDRFREARRERRSDDQLLGHLNAALQFCKKALALLPPDVADEVARANNVMGVIYGDAGDFDRSVAHFREAISRFEAAGNAYEAAASRFNVALTLTSAGRLTDALEYASAALRNFESFGARAAANIQDATFW